MSEQRQIEHSIRQSQGPSKQGHHNGHAQQPGSREGDEDPDGERPV